MDPGDECNCEDCRAEKQRVVREWLVFSLTPEERERLERHLGTITYEEVSCRSTN